MSPARFAFEKVESFIGGLQYVIMLRVDVHFKYGNTRFAALRYFDLLLNWDSWPTANIISRCIAIAANINLPTTDWYSF